MIRETAKSNTKNVSELHVTRRTVFENHCSTSNTTTASYGLCVLQRAHI